MPPSLVVNSCVQHGEFGLVAIPFVAILYVYCLYLWAKYGTAQHLPADSEIKA